MEAYDNQDFQSLVNDADLVVPDGKPLAIGLKLLGNRNSHQVRGADITRELLKCCSKNGFTLGFYGGTQEAIDKIKEMVRKEYPSIKLGCAVSPPFRKLSVQEDNNYIEQINESDVQILLVGLGCPKQEQWMAEHKGHVKAVMIGVGAVFDFLSGTKSEAPKWIHTIGFEWLYRLLSEPKRLWRRYAVYNPRFIWNFSKQLMTK
jgi:N-acetylglucosaminyldiphosphoundecaprenol N-acetyl-beta-D-mannosaminyltransferase